MIRVVTDRNARQFMARLDRRGNRVADTNRDGIDLSSRAWAELVLLSVIWGGTFLSVAIALREIGPAAARIARAEGFTAHARSIELRLGGDGDG